MRAIRRHRLEIRVGLATFFEEVIGDAARGQRLCGRARRRPSSRRRPRRRCQAGPARVAGPGGRVRGLAVLAREAPEPASESARYASTATHSGESEGQAPGAGPAVEDQLAAVAAGRRSSIARGRLNPGRGVSPTDGRLCANGFADKTSVAVLCSCVSIRPRVRKTESAPRTGGKPSSARASHSPTAPDPRTHAQTWLKTKKRLARPSSRRPPTKRSPRRTGASTT